MHSEHRLLARDNHPVWIQEEAVLVSDAAGKPLYVLGIMLDITARKEAEDDPDAPGGTGGRLQRCHHRGDPRRHDHELDHGSRAPLWAIPRRKP